MAKVSGRPAPGTAGGSGRNSPSRPRSRRPNDPRVYARRRFAVVGAAAVVILAVLYAVSGSSGASHPHPASRPTTAPARPVAVDAARFATGACERFAPTSGDRHVTVFLDAGHGGLDPGSVGTTESGATIYEADETLRVELDAAALLRAAGFEVVVSRTGDTTVDRLGPADVVGRSLTLKGSHDDVAARDVCANLAGASLLVGIYFDAGASASNAGSVTGYDTARSFSAQNLRFADILQSDVLAAMNARGWRIPDEGAVPDSSLGSLAGRRSDGGLAAEAASYGHLLELGPARAGFFSTPSRMPGAVVEPLFITDPFEGSLADSGDGQHVMASGIARAVEQYFAPPVPTTTSSA